MDPPQQARRTPWGWSLAVLAGAVLAAVLLPRLEEERDAPERAPLERFDRPAPELPASPPEETRSTATPSPLEPLRVASIPAPEDTGELQREREEHIRVYIVGRGVRDEAALAAMRQTPRHAFVPVSLRRFAYDDRPLPIGEDQTISQPYIVASMTEEARLKQGDKVLEVGTGSGYQAAVLAAITPHVFSIEIKEALARTAAARLRGAGYDTVKVAHADGYYGWPEEAPFDAILVTACAPHVPPPLVEQLKPGGRMVLPVGEPFAIQDLVLVTKDEAGVVRTRSLYPVQFVPLTGSLGESAR